MKRLGDRVAERAGKRWKEMERDRKRWGDIEIERDSEEESRKDMARDGKR